jgi:serine/threonine protein phosphatase PrpC
MLYCQCRYKQSCNLHVLLLISLRNGGTAVKDLMDKKIEGKRLEHSVSYGMFGNAKEKLGKEGGSLLVDIVSFRITNQHDFILMGCDEVFEHLLSKDAVCSVWTSSHKKKEKDVHEQCGIGVDSILKNVLLYGSSNNSTSVLIAFRNFKNLLFTNKPNTEELNSKKKAEGEIKTLIKSSSNKILLKTTKRIRLEELKKRRSIIAEVKNYNI